MKFFWCWLMLLWMGPLARAVAAAPPDSVRGWSVSVAGHYGFIFAHNDGVAHLAVSHPVGWQVDIGRQASGRRAWHQAYGRPEWGFTYHGFGTRQPDVLGMVHSLTAFIEPTLAGGRRHRLAARGAAGLGYTTRPFDLRDNPTNTALGGRLSFAMLAQFSYYFRPAPGWRLRVALAFSHYSNGAFALPNAGINFVTAQVGVGKALGAPQPARRAPAMTFRRRWRLLALGTGGWRQIEPPGGRRYFVGQLGAFGHRRLGRYSALQLGVEWFHSEALRTYTRPDGDHPGADFRRVGVTLGHELFVSRLTVITQIGYYLYNPLPVHIDSYLRLGLRYHATDRWFGQAAVKSHLARAEVVEWGIGYRFF